MIRKKCLDVAARIVFLRKLQIVHQAGQAVVIATNNKQQRVAAGAWLCCLWPRGSCLFESTAKNNRSSIADLKAEFGEKQIRILVVVIVKE